jgi:predicted DNA-binding protein with PD1-like motif
MKAKLLHEVAGQRTFAVVLQSGDETMACVTDFAVRENIDSAQITAIGAFSCATLAYFDWQAKSYMPIMVDEQVEVASLLGDIATGPDGGPSVHLHAVLGRRDGSAVAGHLTRAYVRPTLEIVVTEQPAHLRKVIDAESGLALIRL